MGGAAGKLAGAAPGPDGGEGAKKDGRKAWTGTAIRCLMGSAVAAGAAPPVPETAEPKARAAAPGEHRG